MTDSNTYSTADSLRFISDRRRPRIAAVAATAFVGGTIEAIFLITITQVAFAITDDSLIFENSVLPAMSVGEALVASTFIIIVRLCVSAAASAQGAYISARSVAEVRSKLSAAYLAADWPTQQSQPAGSLQQLLGGYSSNAAGLVQGLIQSLVSGANLTAMLVLAVIVDPISALAVIVIGGCLAAILRPVRQAVRRRATHEARLGWAYASTSHEVSQIGLELNVFGIQNAALARIEGHIGELERAGRRVGLARNLLTPVYSSLAYLAIVAALFFTNSSGSADISAVGAGVLVMLRSLGYAQALQSSSTAVLSNAPAVSELQTVLDDLHRGRRHAGQERTDEIWPISVNRLDFAYSSDAPVLRDVSFQLAPREIVGLVGPSGSGKSTLVELLLGLRQPASGSITAAGSNLTQLNNDLWTRAVTFVPQRTHIIQGSIADNIRFLRDDVSEEQIRSAARQANIFDEVTAFPEGFDRMLGGGSSAQLSGGQAQRIAIARALVETPQLLILDEPTSALDAVSEVAVRKTLSGLRDQTSILIVAHRQSTLEICDRLLRLKNGQLEEFEAADLEHLTDLAPLTSEPASDSDG